MATKVKILLAIVVSLSLMAALACAADEDPTAVPAAVQPPPATAVPAVPVTVPATAVPAAVPAPATAVPATAPDAMPGMTKTVVKVQDLPPYKYDVALDSDQVLVNPGGRRSHIEFWKEGSSSGRFWEPWTHMGPFRTDHADEFVQGVALAYSVNDDATVYQIHFNPEAVFTDGTPFTAELAKASWEFGSAPEQQASWGGAINYTRSVEGMEAVGAGDATEAAGLVVIDHHTLEIRLKSPAYTFPFSMARSQLGFANMPLIEGDPDWRTHVPGIGQFTVTYDPDKGEQTVRRSPNYWGDPANLDGVDMPNIQDQQTRFIMYENGEADIGPNFAVRDESSHTLFGDVTFNRSGGCCWYVGFALDKQPFEDINVRAALAHAVDLSTIVDAVYPGSFLAAGIINGDLPCADLQKTPYEYDVAKAKQLLAESTYGSAANLPPITVSLRNAEQIQIAVLTQEAWRDNLGVELTLHKRESGQTIPPEANLYRRSRGTSSPDVAELMWEMSHSDSTLHDDLGWSTDPGQSEIDALVDAAMTLPLDDPGRCDAFIEVERAMRASYKFLPNSGVGSGPGNLVAPWVLGYQTRWYGDSTNLPYWKIGERDRSLYPGHTWK